MIRLEVCGEDGRLIRLASLPFRAPDPDQFYVVQFSTQYSAGQYERLEVEATLERKR